MPGNHQVAALLEEMADLLEIKGENRFKIRAYRMAATRIRELVMPVEKIGERAALMQIESVGEAIADKILEILQGGDFKAHREILQEIPHALLPLLRIEGLGPKRVAILYRQLNIKNLADLQQAAEQDTISAIKGFGRKIREKILQGIRNLAQAHGRFRLDEVMPVATALVERMRAVPGIDAVCVAGSLRRWKETVKDLDILVTGNAEKSNEVMHCLTSYGEVQEVVAQGETKTSVKLKNDLNIDLRFVEPDCFGASMQYFTGSKEHNIALRTYAKDKGFKTSEYGLFKLRGKKEEKMAGKSEEEFYAALGMQYIEPELRENAGEIERALAHTLPQLITRADLKGDLHMHTTASDGIHSLADMIEAARKLGHRYIAITEHSVSARIANGLDCDRLRRWCDEIRECRQHYHDIEVFTGIEVDIRKDGSLDFDDEILRECEVVVASLHASLHMESEEMTRRLVTAVSHPLVNILGHPTARMLQEREAAQYDFEQVLAAAVKNGVAFEINSSPQRLDLKDVLIRRVIASGGKVCIDSDAHATGQLNNIELGVHMARRGWCRAEDCVNAWDLAAVKKFLKK
jgi:DNA polymerase (family 10)